MNPKNLHNKVIENMENQIEYHKMLAKYTKQSVKLKKHLYTIDFLEDVVEDYKKELREYGWEFDHEDCNQ